MFVSDEADAKLFPGAIVDNAGGDADSSASTVATNDIDSTDDNSITTNDVPGVVVYNNAIIVVSVISVVVVDTVVRVAVVCNDDVVVASDAVTVVIISVFRRVSDKLSVVQLVDEEGTEI